MSLPNIQAAILQSRGPVCTHSSMITRWRFLRKLNSAQFLEVAKDLEAANLGTVVPMSEKTKPLNVFVKKKPEEISLILKSVKKYQTTPELYKARYDLPIPGIVNINLRKKLYALGLIPSV